LNPQGITHIIFRLRNNLKRVDIILQRIKGIITNSGCPDNYVSRTFRQGKKINSNEVNNRVKALQRLLTAIGLKAAFITAPADVRYFSGFTGSESYLLITPRKKLLITDNRYSEEAEKTAPDFQMVIWKMHPAEFSAQQLNDLNIDKCGICQNNLTVTWHKHLTKKKIRTVAIDSVISNIRSVKSDLEIRAIAKALRCAEEAFTNTLTKIREGMTEMDVRLELEWQMMRLGASEPAFETIVAAGANASLPHAHAGTRKLKANKMLLIDFGARVNGYNSDLTRTLFIGNIPKIWLERYELILQAQQAGIDAIKAGVACAEADKAARKVFAQGGVLDNFTHSLGHGVGLEVHEAPRLSERSKDKLKEGNIVTVEPGLYFPGSGGIRTEDMVAVTENGAKVLSTLAKDAESMVI